MGRGIILKNNTNPKDDQESETSTVIKKIEPLKRIKAINFLDRIYCIICEYKDDCSARYPDYIYKCRYIEEWSTKKYLNHIKKKTNRNEEMEKG